jgi:hypothetical protein
VKIRAFWDVAPCSLIGVHRRLKGAYCLHHQDDEYYIMMGTTSIIALMIEAVRTSETSVYSYETTWRYIPEGSNLRVLCYLQANIFRSFVNEASWIN